MTKILFSCLSPDLLFFCRLFVEKSALDVIICFFFQIILTVSSSPLNRQRGVLNAGGDNIVYT